ncbi:MAG: hypothetical protein HC801_11595 [Nitrospira sp.]|nr:hypothetical protein [Nitrospira sp.]
MQAWRFYTEGAATAAGGERQIKFDLANPRDMAEIIGTAIGFTPTRLSQFYDKRAMQVESAHYWNARRTALLAQYEHAYRNRDKKELSRLHGRIKEYTMRFLTTGWV